ncbi:hypothetical protein GOV11_05115, partial [Candidatus Woesearchaeota archaeon]|nr:hypothetical protein [Candidatus Woesearchaeota archaeon]
MVDKRIHTIVRGINDGIISAQEAHTLLQAEFGITLEQARSIRNPQKKHPEVHGTMPYIIVAGFVIAILSGMFYLPGSDLTGFAVFDLGQE